MSGLDVLTQGLFDYAGLFPPAALELPEALRRAARATRLYRPRIVGTDLVVPLDPLAKLGRQDLYFSGFGDTTCTLAVVGVERKGLPDAIRQVREYNRKNAPWLKVVSLEVHGAAFPPQLVASLRGAQRRLGDIQLWLEPRWTQEDWARGQRQILALLSKLQGGAQPVGLKIRCAGPTAASKATLEHLLPAVVAAGIPLKATQGLHHAFPEGKELGFLNLAMAVRLLQVHGPAFPAPALANLLREGKEERFSFKDGVAWRNHAIPEPILRKAVADYRFVIGSCSIEEPDAELAQLAG